VPELPELGLRSVDLEQGLDGVDIVAVVTAHPGIDYEQLIAKAPRTIDFRGVTRGLEADNLSRL